MSKVLFIYPNKESYPIIPAAIGMLSGVLKYQGHTVDLFDITFMVEDRFTDHKAREKLRIVEKTDIDKYWGKPEKVNIKEKLLDKISLFKPDLIAFTVVENNYVCARDLFAAIKAKFDIPIIAGGMFPTVAEDFFINDKNVDMICVGEGEAAIVELAGRMDRNRDYSDVANLIVKQKGRVIRNKPAPYYNWQPPVFQDWSIFDQRHFYKPFMGRVWKTGYFELSRGCPYNCSYCNNYWYQQAFKDLGPYRRERSIEGAIEEMVYKKDRYSLELAWFHDENFCMMSDERFDEFCAKYKDRVGLPFFIMTRADTLLDESRLRKIKDAGCATISMGIETGDGHIRASKLNKNVKNSVYLRAFDNCRKYGIRTTANVMVGLPGEKEEDILKTIDFCKECRADSIGIAIFVPYYGTKLRKECIEKGLIEDRYYDDISFSYTSILKMTGISKKRFEEIYYNFNDLVYGAKSEKYG
ncbi:MAG: radical SAM protein [Candidatus Omnitrophota bacterium]